MSWGNLPALYHNQASGLSFVVEQTDAYAGAVFKLPNLDPHRRYELRAAVADATPGALLEFDDLSRDGHPIIGGGPVQGPGSEISTVFQPQTREVDLFVGMTTYGGNPTGFVTVSRLSLTEREDWSRTVAYVLDTGDATEGRRIRINVRGREPNGIVESGAEYERVRDWIASGVLQLRDDAGRPLIASVYRREDLYHGPYADEGPDIVVAFADGVGGIGPSPDLAGYALEGPISVPVTKGNSGNHRREGVFVAHGRAIRPGTMVEAEIVDVCPTVLHLLGVAAPADLDGRVLLEAIAPGRSAAALSGSSDAARPRVDVTEAPDPYTDSDRRRVEERLRKLGYME